MRSRSANHVHKSWPQRFVVNVLDGRREVRSLHTRSLALVLQRNQRLETRIRSLEQALHGQRHRRGARFSDRARARLNRRLASFSNRRRSSSTRIALERRSSEDAATQAIRQVAFHRAAPRQAAPWKTLRLLDSRWLVRRQRALDQEAPARRLCGCCCGCADFVICFTSAVESHS